jgi:hypothetical protein
MFRYISFFCHLLFFLLSRQLAFSQSAPIKVYVLGSFDFNEFREVFDAADLYRQKEIYALSQLLYRLGPDKVFLPFSSGKEDLARTDSMFKAFCFGDSTRHQDARLQIGFRTAKRLGHHKVFSYGSPADSSFWYGQARLLAKKYEQNKLLSGRERGSKMPTATQYRQDSLLKILSLREFLAWQNAKVMVMNPVYRKASVWPRLGNTYLMSQQAPDYPGAKLLSHWYEEHIRLYACILNQLDFGEKAILIMTEPERVGLLRHLFESNPGFQVIPAESWLGKSPVP